MDSGPHFTKLNCKTHSVTKYRTQSRQFFAHTLPENPIFEKLKIPFIDYIKESEEYDDMLEFYANGAHNVQRLLKIFNYLQVFRRKYQWKSPSTILREKKLGRLVIDMLKCCPPHPVVTTPNDIVDSDDLDDSNYIEDPGDRYSLKELINFIMIKERFLVNYQQLGDEEIIAELLQRFVRKQIPSDEWWITKQKQYNSNYVEDENELVEDENELVTKLIKILKDRIASGTYIILTLRLFFFYFILTFI